MKIGLRCVILLGSEWSFKVSLVENVYDNGAIFFLSLSDSKTFLGGTKNSSFGGKTLYKDNSNYRFGFASSLVDMHSFALI